MTKQYLLDAAGPSLTLPAESSMPAVSIWIILLIAAVIIAAAAVITIIFIKRRKQSKAIAAKGNENITEKNEER